MADQFAGAVAGCKQGIPFVQRDQGQPGSSRHLDDSPVSVQFSVAGGDLLHHRTADISGDPLTILRSHDRIRGALSAVGHRNTAVLDVAENLFCSLCQQPDRLPA